ncbi:hypothetical protein ACOMHN_020195 [Nucella lapillus]
MAESWPTLSPAWRPVQTPLLDACKSGNYFAALRSLGAHANVNETDGEGRTSLYIAAQDGHDDIVELLLRQAWVKVDAQRDDGRTALMAACQFGRVEAAKKLLRRNARVNLLDTCGRGALSLAFNHGQGDAVKLLLDHPETNDNVYIVKQLIALAMACCDVELLRMVIQRPQCLNLDAEDLNAILHYACVRDLDDIVIKLLKIGANVYDLTKDKYTNTPLHAACMTNSGLALRAILSNCSNDSKVNVNVTNGAGETPLHCAIKIASRTCVFQLLSYPSIDINARDGTRNTALSLACERVFDDLVKALVTRGADVNICGPSGLAPLTFAVQHGKLRMASYILESPNLQVNAAKSDGSTALLCCSQDLAYLPVTSKLIQRGADVNLTDCKNRSPLFLASLWNNLELVKQILNVPNCQVDIVSESGATALHVACMHGHEEVVKLLLQHHANADLAVPAKDRDYTAIQMAINTGQVRIVKMLSEIVTDLRPATDVDVVPVEEHS